ncbi:MAG TPA: hypothetical protein VF462_15070 [Micromonosporaceae bacterium]
MVYVRLEQEWTDKDGATHAAGEMVDVDAATLASLQQEGVVAGEKEAWAGPTGTDDANWAGPTGTEDPTGTEEANWAGPTGAQP